MFKAIAATALALCLFAGAADAAKRRHRSPPQKKRAAPELSVGSSCEVAREIHTRSGPLKIIAFGATVKVTSISKDNLAVSTAAGNASVNRRVFLAACSSPPQLRPEAPAEETSL
jgi:hypothetical protein